MAWEPITRGKPKVMGINAEGPGLLDVSVPLSSVPPPAWVQFFDSPPDVSVSVTIHPPRLSGREVFITPPDGQIREYVAQVDTRIGAANRMYEDIELPRLREQGERQQTLHDQERVRIERAQDEVDDL